jgi:hypothetical protein
MYFCLFPAFLCNSMGILLSQSGEEKGMEFAEEGESWL